MIMDLLGQNLETLMKNNIAHCLSLKSVLMCAIQMVILYFYKYSNLILIL